MLDLSEIGRGPRSHWAADIWKNIPMRKTATLATASGVLRGAQIGIQNADGEIRACGAHTATGSATMFSSTSYFTSHQLKFAVATTERVQVKHES